MKIMVLGGTGFIGRHTAAALHARGHEVVIGTRHPDRARRRLSLEGSRPRWPSPSGTLQGSESNSTPTPANCELRETHLERLTTKDAWCFLLTGLDGVINCVGILRERFGETYDRVHRRAPAALARACTASGLRLVHVSALGLHDGARSRFLLGKLAGERAIMLTHADYSIVRPSLLDGEGGYGAAWVRRVARWPIHFHPADAVGRMAALDVGELGEAIAILSEARGRTDWREVELGGTAARTMAEYLNAMRALHHRAAAIDVPVPALLARLVSHLCDLLHLSPFSDGHLELLRRDNLPRLNLLPALLGRTPLPIGRSTLDEALKGDRPAVWVCPRF